MPFPRRTRSLGIATASAVIAVVSSCVAPRQRSRHADAPGCEFIVYNRTPHALEVRLGVRRLSSSPIGALNPGELLTHSVPCALRRVWIRGIPIPPQVGVPATFRFVEAQGSLAEKERVQIALQWP